MGFFLCSALAEQRPSKPTTPQKDFRFFSFLSPVFGEHPPKHAVDWGSEESIVQRPNGQVRSFRGPPSPPSFSTGPWSSCIVTGHDQSMHCPLFSRPSQMQCMQYSALPSRVRSSNSACGLPEVFHVSPRSRSIARVDLRRWCDHASDRSQVFRLQANDAIYQKCFRG